MKGITSKILDVIPLLEVEHVIILDLIPLSHSIESVSSVLKTVASQLEDIFSGQVVVQAG